MGTSSDASYLDWMVGGASNANILSAIIGNIVSWLVTKFVPSKLPYLLPVIPEEAENNANDNNEEHNRENENEEEEMIVASGGSSPSVFDDHDHDNAEEKGRTVCVAIGRPGGTEQLRLITLKEGYVTCGYNVRQQLQQHRHSSSLSSSDALCRRPFLHVPTLVQQHQQQQLQTTSTPENRPSSSSSVSSLSLVVVRIYAFSINYADCCIRWGLYESANKYVGYPIVPGFDVAGIVEQVIEIRSSTVTSSTRKRSSSFQKGDRVYGCSFFGAYSTRALIPSNQLRKIPDTKISFAQAAAVPAVALTALYALHLGGAFPFVVNNNNTNTDNKIDKKMNKDIDATNSSTNTNTNSNITVIGGSKQNKSILIHSAAGGVGSMLVQMSQVLGLSPIVGVVGRTSKVSEARSLGCDIVIDKEQETKMNATTIWKAIERAGPEEGYSIIMDPNGVSTLQDSYDHLCPTGRLVVFGFHSNLPMDDGRSSSAGFLNPLEWMKMIIKSIQMPKFDPMDMVTSNKSVLGFNLSFFVDEIDMLTPMYDQIETWLLSSSSSSSSSLNDDGNDDDSDNAKTSLLRFPRITQLKMEQIGTAHKLIQSGKTIGKLVMIAGGRRE